MLNINFGEMDSRALGRFAESLAKNIFVANGYQVYVPEVDDRGIDFIAQDVEMNIYYVQVKSVRKRNYTFVRQKYFTPDEEHLVFYIQFNDTETAMYIIPGTAWEKPNVTLTVRNYDEKGQKSDPEYGISGAKKNEWLLEPYRAENYFNKMQKK